MVDNGLTPIENLVNSLDAVVEGQVARRELLIPERCTGKSTVKHEVAHKTAGTLFDEEALVLCPLHGTQAKRQILQACRLTCGPVDTVETFVSRHRSRIKDQILNLPVENVGGFEAQSAGRVSCITGLILIAVDERKVVERRAGLDHWKVIGVSDDLSHIVVDDRSRDLVGACREINDCGCLGRMFAFAGGASPARTNGQIDSCGVI